MKNIKKYISNLITQEKSFSEIKIMVKKSFPDFDLRTFPKVWRLLESTKKSRVIKLDRIKEPPRELKPDAYQIWVHFWKTKDPSIEIIGMDHYLIAGFCIEYALYQKMRSVIEVKGATFETDKGYVQVRPEVTLGNTAFKNAQSVANDFGYTLKSRMGMGLVGSGPVKVDPMDALTKKIGKVK